MYLIACPGGQFHSPFDSLYCARFATMLLIVSCTLRRPSETGQDAEMFEACSSSCWCFGFPRGSVVKKDCYLLASVWPCKLPFPVIQVIVIEITFVVWLSWLG